MKFSLSRWVPTVALSIVVIGFLVIPNLVMAQDDPEVDIGGALRWNFFIKDWDDQTKETWGRWALDTFRLNADASYAGMYMSAEYRFYAGYHMLHHGYIGYDFDENSSMHFGVHQVPFGIQPYASHNWFFQLPYYVGLEDDYDAGIKFMHHIGNFDLAYAYYLNSEGTYTGNSVASARYSYDIVPTGDTNQSENNQGNIRLAYNFSGHQIGVSGQYGQLYNPMMEDQGSRWAWGVHGDLNFGNLNFKLEAIGYQFSPEVPEGMDDTVVMMGAYDFPYAVASEAMFFVAGVAYGLPVDIGPISKLTFYENYTLMQKAEDDFEDSMNAITGVMVTAGNLYTYVDVAMGKNHPWIGPNYGTALAAGTPDANWWTRFNINMGYYF